MSASASEASSHHSSGSGASRRASRAPGRARLALAGVALVGALLLVIAEFMPLYRVLVGEDEAVRSVASWRNHGFAMLLLALAGTAMALGALRGARPAMFALAGIGVVVLVVALTVDLDAARQEGTLREAVSYENARAEPAAGFFLETLGGVLLLLSGGVQALLGRGAAPGSG
jgi:hypothetical protein